MKLKTKYIVVYKVVQRISNSSLCAEGKYYLTYDKGSTVKAVPGSVGVMCFKTKKHAVNYIQYTRMAGVKIIRVAGIGTPVYPLNISSYPSEFALNHFYTPGGRPDMMPAPNGTVCYQEVIILG